MKAKRKKKRFYVGIWWSVELAGSSMTRNRELGICSICLSAALAWLAHPPSGPWPLVSGSNRGPFSGEDGGKASSVSGQWDERLLAFLEV